MATALHLYDYDLPAHLIAQTPLPRRDASRLMVLRRGRDAPAHHRFHELVDLLPAGALLVANNTRVLPCRLRATLPSGARVEALLLTERAPGEWEAMVKRARRLKPGLRVPFADGNLPAEAVERTAAGNWLLRFEAPHTVRERLQRHGEAPLPPYIHRNGDAAARAAADREAYQTCYARVEGAVAAPTAGLHFTPELLQALQARGVEWAEVTLHVGPGTFRPVAGADADAHDMHAERYEVPPQAARQVRATREAGRPVVAVGTTSVRALESWALSGYGDAVAGETRLFIRPPYTFRAVDGLITNFHLPRSTLLMLVAAFHGRERTLAAYRAAVAAGYRFFSYGDAMAILP